MTLREIRKQWPAFDFEEKYIPKDAHAFMRCQAYVDTGKSSPDGTIFTERFLISVAPTWERLNELLNERRSEK